MSQRTKYLFLIWFLVLAIPGFLQLQENEDYFVKDLIAKGGFGSIYFAELNDKSKFEGQLIAKKTTGIFIIRRADFFLIEYSCPRNRWVQ